MAMANQGKGNMRPRIIVLDDDASCRDFLCQVLTARGYEVLSAAEPSLCPLYRDLDAQFNHEHACGDLLLSDNRMPGMTGLEFVSRQQKRGCKGVIHNKAILSGSWQEVELKTAEQLGCQIFTKPYKLDELLGWLEGRIKAIPPGRQLAELG